MMDLQLVVKKGEFEMTDAAWLNGDTQKALLDLEKLVIEEIKDHHTFCQCKKCKIIRRLKK